MRRLWSFLVAFLFPSLLYAASTVALVTGDRNSENSRILEEFLNSKGYRPQLIELKQGEAFPGREIFQYLKGAVIRVVEDSLPSTWMDAEEASFWIEFLTSHGSLVLFGDSLGSAEVYEAGLTQYIGFDSLREVVVAQTLNGSSHDLISEDLDLAVRLTSDRHVIKPRQNSGIDVVYQTNSGQVLGMKQQSCSFRMSYFTFLPSEIQDSSMRTTLLHRTLDWNLGFALGVGMQAPDFPVLQLNSELTGIYNLWNQHSESVIFLEFFATWCSSCEAQLPKIISLRNKFREEPVLFHFVSYKEPVEELLSYLGENPEIDWSVSGTQNGLGARRYGLKALPGIYIIDRKRKVRFIHQGSANEGKLERELREILSVKH
ncbi:TlpA family protein disulfide reductase [bacterium]|jgi:cytochrome c biogenesis protein CcmG, thiol:disulfide interchange protein DsbE|nr:TlpA family protein disulfide reductase [bacterium]